jgi:hypothetical protein
MYWQNRPVRSAIVDTVSQNFQGSERVRLILYYVSKFSSLYKVSHLNNIYWFNE